MATFKVGDRVRIVNPRSALCGREAVIYAISHDRYLHDFDDIPRRSTVQYLVDVVGYGRRDLDYPHTPKLGYEAQDLAPLLPPAADEWATSKVREVTKPVYTEPMAPAPVEIFRIRGDA